MAFHLIKQMSSVSLAKKRTFCDTSWRLIVQEAFLGAWGPGIASIGSEKADPALGRDSSKANRKNKQSYWSKYLMRSCGFGSWNLASLVYEQSEHIGFLVDCRPHIDQEDYNNRFNNCPILHLRWTGEWATYFITWWMEYTRIERSSLILSPKHCRRKNEIFLPLRKERERTINVRLECWSPGGTFYESRATSGTRLF